jgi:hypothetical protein
MVRLIEAIDVLLLAAAEREARELPPAIKESLRALGAFEETRY